MNHRPGPTIVNGQPVTQEFEMGYDAENRLVSVTGVNGTTLSVHFTYNGDGQKVKSVINGETILFVGGYFEVLNPGAGQTITKYYFAGASRIAMRKYTIPQTMTLEYFLGDHLGSTSITTDNTGTKVSEMRYEPCPYRVLREGEVRSQHLHLHAGASVTGCDNELESNHCLLKIRVIRVEMFLAIIAHHEIPAPQRTYPALSRCTARLRTTHPLHRLLLG